MDAELDVIRETMRDEAGPSLGAQLDARSVLLAAIDAGGELQAPRAGRRCSARRVGLASAVAAIAVLVVASRLWPVATQPTWVKQALQRAAAVVIPPASSRTILHVAVTETLSPRAQRASATTVSTFSGERWLQQGAPYHERTIVHVPGAPVFEQNSLGQVYNMTSNVLYLPTPLPSAKPRYTLLPGPKPGTFRLRVKLQHGYATSTIDIASARSLRDGTDEVAWAATWNGHVQRIVPLVVPSRREMRKLSAQQPSGSSASFAPELRALLYSGHARVTRVTTADGKPAIEIASVHPQGGPRTIYYVNPKTYAPIELDLFGYDSVKDVTRVRFTTYETFPVAGHQRLLRFTVPGGARIDRNSADYWHALAALPRYF